MRLRKILTEFDAFIACAALATLLVTILLQVVLRFVFQKPLMGAEEFTRFMVIFVVMTPLAFAERTKSHVVMEEVQAMLPDAVRRILRVLIDLCTTAVYCIVAFSAIGVLLNNAKNETATLRMPFWLFFLPTVIGFISLAIVRASMLLRRTWKDF